MLTSQLILGPSVRPEIYTDHSSGYGVPPVAQFMYQNKILFPLPIEDGYCDDVNWYQGGGGGEPEVIITIKD